MPHRICENGRARMDVGEVAPLRRAAAIRSGALQPRAAATRAYLGLARTYVPRNRALIVFDRYQTEGDGGRRTARHQTEGDGGRRRPDTGGGGSREEAAARRRRRWPEAGGGGLREAGTRGRRRAEGGDESAGGRPRPGRFARLLPRKRKRNGASSPRRNGGVRGLFCERSRPGGG